jgi:chemotaxis protein methyltransferase CheR
MPPQAPIELGFDAKLSTRCFETIKRLVYDNAGIDLSKGKEQLVAARLAKLVRNHRLRSYDEYVERIIADRTSESLVELIDAISTNFTSFLREPTHFEFMRKSILPNLRNRGEIRIWCAAAATGEEPYSLLFSAIEELGAQAGRLCRILATDISTKALATAQKGIYPEDRLAPVPREWLSRYLLRGESESTGFYLVKPEFRRQIEFRQLNLIQPSPMGCQFPLISCRNVMIYFDKATQQRVVDWLTAQLEPGGYLFIGHSDGLAGINHSLMFVQPAIYRKPTGPEGRNR